jgi:hypothetical protein
MSDPSGPLAELYAPRFRCGRWTALTVRTVVADLSTTAGIGSVAEICANQPGLELGETVCAPCVEDSGLPDAVFQADLAAFGAHSPELATRYR